MNSSPIVRILSYACNNTYRINLLKRNFCSKNYEYSSSTTASRYKDDIPIVNKKVKKYMDIKDNVGVVNSNLNEIKNLFPDNSNDFFDNFKKYFVLYKNDLNIVHKYCKEIMYRINDKNIHPKIITNIITSVCYTEYKNDRVLSEILNRCILRLNEFDLVHICSLINSLGKIKFKSIYFMEEVQKKLMSENKNYFDKHSPHYICLLINSLVKLKFFNKLEITKENKKEYIYFLLDKIYDRKVTDFSLVGLSLLLYNISKLKLKKYYFLFPKFELHIVRVKNDLNIIQTVNILSAYSDLNFANFYFVELLLEFVLSDIKTVPTNSSVSTDVESKLDTNINSKLGTNINSKLGTNINSKLGTNINSKLGTNINSNVGTVASKYSKLNECSLNHLIRFTQIILKLITVDRKKKNLDNNTSLLPIE
ncbi:conserved protein, unknown function, partial [Hepatocystis sp. ex Piliocolobus tephrosceles]